jgi:hypothetical protein
MFINSVKSFVVRITLILGLTLFFIGCNNTIYPFYIPSKAPKIPENDIEKYIPRYPDGKLFGYYILTKQKQKQLGLTIPENGHDSLLMRLWFTYPKGLYQIGELVELKIDSNQNVSAKYTLLDIFFNPSRRYEVINSHFDTLMTPKCGWKSFLDTLNLLQITNLPSLEFVPEYIKINGKDNYDYDNNRMTVSIEVATQNKYRFFQYNSFEKYKNIDEVNRLYKFLVFQRKQLELKEVDESWY